MKFNKICILGLGYIGLPTASMFALSGVQVLGVDNNPDIVKTLKNGKIHIKEPGLVEIIKEAFDKGVLIVDNNPDFADAFIIAVPTPFLDDKKADMSYVISAAESILPFLRAGNLVILESTSPPLTTENVVRPILEKSGLKAGVDFKLAYSPERVLPGQILRELVENDRVIGGVDKSSAEAGRDLYATFVKGEIVLTDATTSEMVKLMENTYRDINIAIANEFSRLADRFGVNIWEAVQIANRHPRVKILNPGPGVGGHCISVDPWFLIEAAPNLTPLIHTAREVNDSQPDFVLQITERILGSLNAKRITILGLAFKANVDDIRESPAIKVAHLLVEQGAHVMAYEPNKSNIMLTDVNIANSIEEAVEHTDIIILLVGHNQFKELDPNYLADLTSARILLDTVNCWDASDWQKAGFEIFKLGNGKK